MSDDGGWDLAQLARRVAALEAWRRTVQGERAPVVPEPSRLEKAAAACRSLLVPEAVLEAVAAQHKGDDEGWAGALEEIAEEGDLRARARRGGIDLEREDGE